MKRTLALALWCLSLVSMAHAFTINEAKTSVDATSNVDATDDESDVIEKRSAMAAWPEDKRGWKDLQGVWGKREGNWNNLKGLWGKREGNWNNLRGLWGKRQDGNWNNLRGLWGKRSDSYKKRGRQSGGGNWTKLPATWGKRSIAESDEDSAVDTPMNGYDAGN